MKCYRCGHCGQPCDENGNVLDISTIKLMDVNWNEAVQVHGNCCQEQESKRIQITREMAIDGGCPEMEGTWIDW